MYSSAYVWSKVMARMESQLTAPVVSTWFDQAEILELTDDKLVLYVPTKFYKETILRRCTSYVTDAMKDLFDLDVTLEVFCEEEMEDYRNRDSKSNFIDFNPEYTFEKFVVGPSNVIAYNAALAVVERPADVYNPFFLYGDSGLGKTHLLHAIASAIHKRDESLNIIYISGEQFTNELIEAIRVGKNLEFRNKYRNADLFLLDDIQFIAGKEKTEEEFFHTFNTLHANHKQIVLTSDQPPSDMVKLTDRLRSRFESGLICDVTQPDYETRMAIVKDKAESLGLLLSDDVCDYIAENVTNNVRQLEGTVKKIKAYHDLNDMPLDVTNVSRAIKDMYKGGTHNLPTPALILSEVSRFYSIDEDVIRGTQRSKGTAEARQIAMYLIRKLTNLSFPDIALEFGKDHSTVQYAVRKVDSDLRKPGNGLQDNIRDITSNINSKL